MLAGNLRADHRTTWIKVYRALCMDAYIHIYTYTYILLIVKCVLTAWLREAPVPHSTPCTFRASRLGRSVDSTDEASNKPRPPALRIVTLTPGRAGSSVGGRGKVWPGE